MGIDRATVQSAQKVLQDGCEALIQAVATARIPVTVAAKFANLSPVEQLEACELDDKDDIAERAAEAEKLGRQRRAEGAGRATGAKPPQFITLSQRPTASPSPSSRSRAGSSTAGTAGSPARRPASSRGTTHTRAAIRFARPSA
jgi:hypothetical protein